MLDITSSITKTRDLVGVQSIGAAQGIRAILNENIARPLLTVHNNFDDEFNRNRKKIVNR